MSLSPAIQSTGDNSVWNASFL